MWKARPGLSVPGGLFRSLAEVLRKKKNHFLLGGYFFLAAAFFAGAPSALP